MRAIRFQIRGRVQGVGFRYFTLRAARQEGLTGWVSNRRDGSVEVQAQGEESALDRFRQALRRGPPGSRVSGVDEREEREVPRPEGGADFEIL